MFPSTGAAKHVMAQLLSRVAHLEVSEDNLRLGLIVSLITFCLNITHSRSCRTGVSRAPAKIPSHLTEFSETMLTAQFRIRTILIRSMPSADRLAETRRCRKEVYEKAVGRVLGSLVINFCFLLS